MHVPSIQRLNDLAHSARLRAVRASAFFISFALGCTTTSGAFRCNDTCKAQVLLVLNRAAWQARIVSRHAVRSFRSQPSGVLSSAATHAGVAQHSFLKTVLS